MIESSKPSTRNRSAVSKIWIAAALIIILGVVTAIRIRLLNFPLERDEGEFAYAGQLLLQGISPYKAAYTVTLKLPGTFVGYALIMAIFGQTTTAIHAGVILINLASAALVFLLARRIFGNAAAVVATGTYALLSIIPVTLGLAAHATHFVMLFALAGTVLLQDLRETTSLTQIFLAGLLLGLSFLMKQTGFMFGLFGASWVAWVELSQKSRSSQRLTKRLGCLLLGGLLPLILTGLVVAATGDLGHFWFWAFQYAAEHGLVLPLRSGLVAMFDGVTQQFAAAPGLWSLAILGTILLFCERSLRPWRFFIAGFAFFSFLAVCPGWYFRGHYFIQLLPVAGLLAAITFHVTSIFFARHKSLLLRVTPSLVFAVAGASSLIQWTNIYFRLAPAQACRTVYGVNPFPEAVEISRYLASHCPPDASVAIIGSEPEIYFYSHRHSASGHICVYPLEESQPYASAMQHQMIAEIEKANPAYVVYVNIPGSWIQSTARVKSIIFDWFNQYRQQQLSLVGLVEISADKPTEYRWFPPQKSLPEVDSQYWLAVFKNRSFVDSASPKAD